MREVLTERASLEIESEDGALRKTSTHPTIYGGTVAVYRGERLTPGATDWAQVEMAYEHEILLENQDRNVEFQYRIVASNKAGNGKPSNSIMAVL